MHATLPLLLPSDFPAIRRGRLETLQVNLGYRCNQSCLHCHVNAGPTRKEMMSAATVDEVIRYLGASDIRTLDLTGGAPELNPGFRRLVSVARSQGLRVIDRCNLTVLLEPGQKDTAVFLADNQVEIVASLPCYLKENVDSQRGEGVYEDSLEVSAPVEPPGLRKARFRSDPQPGLQSAGSRAATAPAGARARLPQLPG